MMEAKSLATYLQVLINKRKAETESSESNQNINFSNASKINKFMLKTVHNKLSNPSSQNQVFIQQEIME